MAFYRQLILFDRLTALLDKSKIRFVESPFWIKIR